MAFTEEQEIELAAKLNAKHVRTREADGQMLAFIEGWFAIAEANRIFGFDGWDRMTLAADCVWSGMHRSAYVCVYTAKVRVTVRADETEIRREGWGTGEGKGQTPGEAHDTALKTAETDATKRALSTFGNPFGLALYDKEMKGVRNRGRISAVIPGNQTAPRTRMDKTAIAAGDPTVFAAKLRSALELAPTIDALYELWEQNIDALRQLGSMRGGTAIAEDLVARFKQQAVTVVRKGKPQGRESAPVTGEEPRKHGSGRRPGIDKSALALPEPRRVRSPEHLRFVAGRPCLLCGRRPAEAHHLRFVQPRALGRKPSDEYVVPLCALHHRELHGTGDERNWWQRRRIDPVPVARALWAERIGGDAPVADNDRHFAEPPSAPRR